MAIDPSQFQKINVTDTCAVWNILSSQLLYRRANDAGCFFCCTNFVHYECLHKPRTVEQPEDSKLQIRLKEAIEEGQFKSYDLDIEDLQEIEILKKRKNLGKGELASIAFAKKINQAFLTDDQPARKLAEQVMLNYRFVQTTPHLLGRLFFINFLADNELLFIIEEHQQHKRQLADFFREMYQKASHYRSIS